MSVTLTREEARVLSDLLHAYLPELREETYQTQGNDLREQLKRREAVLAGLLTRLEEMLGQPLPS